MKHPLSLITLLLAGLILGCSPSVRSQGHEVTSDTRAVSLERTFATPRGAPGSIPTATPTPAGTFIPESTDTPERETPTKSIPASTPMPAPTSTPAATFPSSAAFTPTNPPAAGSNATPTSPTTPSARAGANLAELAGYGLEVYKQQYCGVCHQLGAAETGGMFGPTHDGMGTTAEKRIQAHDYEGTATTAGEYIRESIISPDAYLVPGYEVTSHHMPAYTHLQEGDIDALVHMLLQQK